ncbi:hypothetical protein [Sphingomonas sp. Marseille-Q8236]
MKTVYNSSTVESYNARQDAIAHGNWNIRRNETITENASEERLLRDMRPALGSLNDVDDQIPPAITRAEIKYLIHNALLKHQMTAHVSLRPARDVSMDDALCLIEQRGPRGDEA